MACVDKISQMKIFRRDLRIVDTLLIKSSFVGKPRPFLIQHIDKSECRGLHIRGRPRTKALQTEAIEWRWLFGSMEWRRNFYEQGITCFFMSDQRVKNKNHMQLWFSFTSEYGSVTAATKTFPSGIKTSESFCTLCDRKDVRSAKSVNFWRIWRFILNTSPFR